MTGRQQRQQYLEQLEVSSTQVADFLERVLSGPVLPPSALEMVLLVQLQTECLDAYCQRWPWRRAPLERYLHGMTATVSAEGLGLPGRNGRDWAAHWCWFASRWLVRKAKINDVQIIESICLLVHRGGEHGGSGDSQPIHATSCLGCVLRAG